MQRLPHSRVLSKRRRRGGSITLEIVLILPLLVLLAIATIQFSVVLMVEQSVVHAATVAAREAGKGATLAQLSGVVDTVLAPHGITVGNQASVSLTSGASNVQVTVSVDMGARPFLNALKYIGIDYTGKKFNASSLALKET